MPAIVVIPSRYASTRFPGKPLCPLLGKPMIEHVYGRVRRAALAQGVVVATDDARIYAAVEGFGGAAVMTSTEHRSGTDRIAEAIERIEAAGAAPHCDIVVNVQGDEPLIMPEMVDEVIRLMEDGRAAVGTLVKRIEDPREIADPNVVKAVFDEEGFALYFSRAPIPYHRDLFSEGNAFVPVPAGARPSEVTMYKHIGIYAYRREALLAFTKLTPSLLEQTEKLEQLRALEKGLKIKVKETSFETIGVDTPMDVERVERCLSLYS